MDPEQLKEECDKLREECERLESQVDLAEEAAAESRRKYLNAKQALDDAVYASKLKYIGRYEAPHDFIEISIFEREMFEASSWSYFIPSDEIQKIAAKSAKVKKGEILLGYRFEEYDYMAFFKEGGEISINNEILISEEQLTKQ